MAFTFRDILKYFNKTQDTLNQDFKLFNNISLPTLSVSLYFHLIFFLFYNTLMMVPYAQTQRTIKKSFPIFFLDQIVNF